jgi:DNA topoisomerase-1
MSTKLVIVESPAKAKTINRFLGRDYTVRASMGHVRDLPAKAFGVDIERGFKPQYVAIPGRVKVLSELKGFAKTATDIYLAPDPDREGEAIAWHLQAALSDKSVKAKFHRITYHEITESAILRAFDQAHEIDQHMVDSQQARRVLDRIVGYRVSPLLWRRIPGASSAGRVQSAALRLVCDREKAILGFKPEEFWIVGANVAKQVDPRDPFTVRLSRIDGQKAEVRSAEEAEAVRRDLDDRAMRVASVMTNTVTKRAPPPFITSTLQQAGSRACGFMPSRTMRIAQTLYEGVDLGGGPVGLITYMRTDSFSVAREAQAACLQYIGDRYGKEYVPEKPNFFRSKSSAQEAHEAIRPTDVLRTPDAMAGHLKGDELKLYRIVWERFVASQMAPARLAQTQVEVEAVPPASGGRTFTFRASSSNVVFPGYMRVVGEEIAAPAPAEEGPPEEVQKLPPLTGGEGLDRQGDWLSEQKFTQPPRRYSDATLVRAMEENGIGRPSTYSSTVTVLYDRSYIEREKRTLKPTTVGMSVNDFLAERLPVLFDVKFTAQMEEQLDEVEEGKVEWTAMLKTFHESFLGWIEAARGQDPNPDQSARMMALLGQVKEWAPPVGKGKRAFSEREFIESLRTQVDGGKALSERQVEVLKRVAWKYREQVPDLAAQAEEFGLRADARDSVPPASPEERARVEAMIGALSGVEFKPASKVRGRTYDDGKFFKSLKQQAEGGKDLSPKQVAVLVRLVRRYAESIPGFEQLKPVLDAASPADEAPTHAVDPKPILDGLRAVTSWKDPVVRGKKTWDDKAFFESLDRQFRESNRLSPRQVFALRKLAKRYKVDAGHTGETTLSAPPGGEPAPGAPEAPVAG